MTALAPGFAGSETLQLAVDDARLMLPYLAFAGPATVMLALSSAQGRFALTAFSPLLFNIALIAVMSALLVWRQDAGYAALVIGRHRRHRRTAAIVISGAAPRRWRRNAAARLVRCRHARLFRQGDPRHGRKLGTAIAGRRRRDHRIRLAVGGVVALFRQPPDRAAARHRRRRHGHRAGAGNDARASRR